MAQENVSVVVSAHGVRVVRRDLESLGNTADRTESSVTLLRQALGALSGAFAARGLYEMLNQFTTLQNRLLGLGVSTEQVGIMFQNLVDIANRTRSSMEATVTMFQRVSMASEVIGINASETASFVETLNKAVIVSGASAREANAAMIQLSQGISSNRLSGEELRSVLEQLPYVADIIAKEFGVTRGALRDMGAEGLLTGERIVQAFRDAREEVENRFANTIPTMSQGLQLVRDSLTNYIGTLDQAEGASGAVASALLAASRNMEELGAITISTGTAIGFAFAPTILSVFNAQLVRMNALIAANPIGALATAIVGLTTYLYLMRQELLLGTDAMTTLGDFMAPVWKDAKREASSFYDTLKSDVGPELSGILERVENLTFYDVIEGLAGTIDELTRMWGGLTAVFETIWSRMTTQLGPTLIDNLNPVLQAISESLNFEPPWIKWAREQVGLEGFKMDFDLTIDKPTSQSNALASRSIDEAYRSGYNLASLDANAGAYVEEAKRIAQVNAQFRNFTEIATLVTRQQEVVEKGHVENTEALKELEKALEEAAKTYQQLNDAVNPDGAEFRQYNERLRASRLLLDNGKISQLEYTAAIGNAAVEYVNATQEGQRYAETLSYIANQQQALSDRRRAAGLEVAAIGMGGDRVNYARQLNSVREQFTQQRFDLEQQYSDASTGMTREEYQEKLGIIQSFEQRNLAVVQAGYEARLAAQRNWKNGAIAGFQEYYDSATDVAEQTKNAITNGFNEMEDAIVNFVRTGKLSFEDFANSVISDITRIAVQRATTSILADTGLAAMFGTPVQGGFTSAIQTGAGYASGGYTGWGGRNEVAGPVHRGEYVFDQEATQRIGVDNLDAMSRGGTVDSGQKEYNITYSPQITVEGGSGGESADQAEERFRRVIDDDHARFRQWLIQEKETGGILD